VFGEKLHITRGNIKIDNSLNKEKMKEEWFFNIVTGVGQKKKRSHRLESHP